MRNSMDDMSVEPNAAIELRDSELLALGQEPPNLVLDLRAYVHRSRGTPGIDPGTGWSQPASIVLANGRLLGPTPKLPCAISDGEVRAGDYWFENLIPHPFASEQPATVELTLSSGDQIRIEADAISLVATGEPEFIEDVDRQ